MKMYLTFIPQEDLQICVTSFLFKTETCSGHVDMVDKNNIWTWIKTARNMNLHTILTKLVLYCIVLN